jgi:hypothetical protein
MIKISNISIIPKSSQLNNEMKATGNINQEFENNQHHDTEN